MAQMTAQELVESLGIPEHRKEPIWAEVIGAIGREELLALEAVPGGAVQLTKIRGVHHEAAQLFAAGYTAESVSQLTGLGAQTLSNLRCYDPAFKALVNHYTERAVEQQQEVQDRLAQLGMLTTELIQERLLEEADSVSMKELTELLKAAMDRGGHSPISRKQEMKVVLTGEELEQLKAQATPRGRVLPADSVAGDGGDASDRPGLETEARQGVTLEGLGLREEVRKVDQEEG